MTPTNGTVIGVLASAPPTFHIRLDNTLGAVFIGMLFSAMYVSLSAWSLHDNYSWVYTQPFWYHAGSGVHLLTKLRS